MIAAEAELIRLVKAGLLSRPDNHQITVDITSVGLHLGPKFLRYKIDSSPRKLPSPVETEEVTLNDHGAIDFPPGACLLACSLERVRMPLDYMGFIQTKGTIARGFVTVHLCDGQIDPGFEGCITLELVNLSRLHYWLIPGIPIAQLFLHRLTEPAKGGYTGRYQFSCEPTAMRSELGFAEPSAAPNSGHAKSVENPNAPDGQPSVS